MCAQLTRDLFSIAKFLLPPTKEEVHVFACVCLFVCLSVSKITQKTRALVWMKYCVSTDVGPWTN